MLSTSAAPIARVSAASASASASALPPLPPPPHGHKSRYVLAAEVALGLTYALVASLASVVVWQLVARGSERHVVAWAVGAICVSLALPLSLHDLHLHLVHYVSPLQKYYMRILCMVPIYAIESWLALRFKEQKIYLETARECYEAYVIHAFFSLLVEFLGPRERTLRLLQDKAKRTGKAHAHMLAPFCCLRPWRLGAEFLDRARLATFQYVVVRLALSIAIFFASFNGEYEEGAFDDAHNLYVYSVIILNLSQLIALWALLMVYHELVEELRPLAPLPKFLAVKAVVFFSFWQSIVIAGLSFGRVISPTLDYSQEEVAAGLQDLLICFEMCGAALAHRLFFSSRDFFRDAADAAKNGPAPLAPAGSAAFRGAAAAFVELMPGDVVKEAGALARAGASMLDPKVLLKPRKPKAAPAAGAAGAAAGAAGAAAGEAAEDWGGT